MSTLACETALEPQLALCETDEDLLLSEGEDLERFAACWDALRQVDPSPVQTLAWSQACAAALAAAGQARFVVSARRGQPLAVAPLSLDPGWPGRARLLGVRELYEPMDLIYGDQAGLHRLAARLVALRRPLVLERVPAESPTVAAVQRAFSGRARVVVRPQPSYPFITLDASWREPQQKLSSRRRSDLRRAWKRAESLGEVSFEMVSPQLDELDAMLDAAFEVEARSWKGAGGTALKHDAFRAQFYRRYTRAACRQGTLRLAWLRIGGAPAAVQIDIEYRRRLWLLKIGYDEQFARASPGSLLIERTIQHAARQELASYEFLGTGADWTRVWTEAERKFVSVRVYPYTLRGAAALAGDGAGWLRRRMARKH